VQSHHHRDFLQRAYEYEVECCKHAATIIASKELVAIRKEVIEEAPDPK